MKLLCSLKRPEKTTYIRDCYDDSVWSGGGLAALQRSRVRVCGMPLSSDKPSKVAKRDQSPISPLSPNHGRFSKTNSTDYRL